MTTSPTAIKPGASGPGTPNSNSQTSTRVLIADSFPPAGIAALREAGCDVFEHADATAENLHKIAADANPDVLIVRSTKVQEPVFIAAPKLSLIVRAGAGYDNIDVNAASTRGVFVANCPGKNSIAVAELVWGLILSCDRRIPDQTAELREGKWNKKEYTKAPGLYGRTLGIVGLGQIGMEVARRGKAFGMKVYAWSRSLTEEAADALGVEYVSNIVNLAKLADVVSVNVASNDQTKNLINAQFCQAMKPGAYLINTSRGSVIDEAAITEAVKTKHIRLGLDVFSQEPAAGDKVFSDPIVKQQYVYGTHHCGASTDQAQSAIADETVRIVKEYINFGRVPNCVNRAATTCATCIMTVRHLNRPGVLAHVFYTLGQAGINVEEMENIIYEGEQAACARIQLATRPGEEDLKTIMRNDHVLSAEIADIKK